MKLFEMSKLVAIKRNVFKCVSSINLQVVLAWLSMIAAILAGSAIGPMFKYMEAANITPCLAASWRCQCMTLFLIPASLIEKYYNSKMRSSEEAPISWFDKKPDLSYPLFVHVIFAGLAWSTNLLCWVIALQYTSTVQASILSSTHPLMLTIYFYIMNTASVSCYEWLGVFTVMTGIVISAMHTTVQDYFNHNNNNNTKGINDSSSSSVNWKYELIGSLLCLCSSASEVVVLLNRIKLKKYLPLFEYTAVTTVIVTIMATLAAIILGDSTGLRGENRAIQVFCISDNCVFGWLAPQWYPIMLLFGFTIGFVCMCGFNYAIVHIPPLVFTSITLVDPLVTGIISWAARIEGVPDVSTWIGGIVVMVGVAVILQKEAQQPQHNEESSSSPSRTSSGGGGIEFSTCDTVDGSSSAEAEADTAADNIEVKSFQDNTSVFRRVHYVCKQYMYRLFRGDGSVRTQSQKRYTLTSRAEDEGDEEDVAADTLQ